MCKCSANYYGVLTRPVVDQCVGCAVRFNSLSNGTVVPADSAANCSAGQYKTNVPCLPTNPDRSVDTTCAACRQSCRPGEISTKFPGEYMSKRCDGSGFDPSVGCKQCTSQCSSDDAYMRPEVVCSGRDDFDTRPVQGCAPCTKQCSENSFLTGRCLRNNTPTSNTGLCVSCAPCSTGQYISRRCNGSTTYDSRTCSSCRYGSANGSLAQQQCPVGSFVVNECSSGTNGLDESNCTKCNSNCEAANFSSGKNGQYISRLCTFVGSGTGADNLCAQCSGRCQSHVAKPPAGEYIVGFCTGATQFDRQCASCRISCQPGEYIAGPPCSGESPVDTTRCEKCTPKPSGYESYTANPCTGATRSDQEWVGCAATCAAGEYVSRECTLTSPTECSKCKKACAPGYFLNGSCDGTTRYDSVQCVPCRNCQEGQHRVNAAACNGTTTADPVSCTACRASCQPGFYIFAR